MSLLNARYFDGSQPGGLHVQVVASGQRLTVRGKGLERDIPLGEVKLGSHAGGGQRIRLSDGAHLVFSEGAAPAGLLRQPIRQPMQRTLLSKIRAFRLSLLLGLILLAVQGYRWSLPQLFDCFSEDLPHPVLVAISDRVLLTLDQSSLAPSAISAAQQAAVSSQFARLRRPAADQPVQLLFRRGTEPGAHALALPDGRLLVLDDLLAVAGDEEAELMALLLHESRHAALRHGLRSLLATSVPVTFSAWWMGDISGLLAQAPAVWLSRTYPPDFEREADQQTAQLLLANGLPPEAWPMFLKKLEAQRLVNPTAPVWTGDLHAGADSRDRMQQLETLGR